MHGLSLLRVAACLALSLLVACAAPEPETASPDATEVAAEAQAFLDGYTERFLELYVTLSEAEWAANTKIVEGDDTNRKAQEAANAAFAEFTGSAEVIETTRSLLEQKDVLEPLVVKQLESVLYQAANNPQTVPELVTERIAAEALQNERLYGFDFQVGSESITTNAIDDVLVTSNDLDQRLEAWAASKEVGRELKTGLADLQRLRNETVQALGYDDYFAYQVSAYDMSVDEMMELNRSFVRDLWPLYRELHTWARYELAERYGEEVPSLLPAHWLPNRWGQDWAGLVEVEGMDLNAVLAEKEPEWVVRQAEDFFVSLGFESLPESFWQRSSLYPVPEGAEYKKNNHASAWHLDLNEDVRCLMSVQPNERWWSTTHHELGHIYYYIAYTRPEVPVLLREGANRGFHEAVGSMLGLASMQRPFLETRGLVDAGAEVDEVQALLKEALDAVVFIPFSAGTMTHFEHDLYTQDLPVDQYNQRWWQYVRDVQGIEPPADRGEEFADAASKTHINNDAAQYYDYAISYVLLYQLHDHVARTILEQDPRATDYYGRKDVGEFLEGILSLGSTQDWREVMREHLGGELSAQPMLDYFEPLTAYLQEQNEGREHALPEQPPV
ncbi:MAG: M2 family metallopeptidase [Acidobacteriota bacterium]